MQQRRPPVSIEQASQESPTLARLVELAKDSADRLKEIEPLIPQALRPSIKAGPIEGSTWCLILDSNAAAAKARQILPTLVTRLQNAGWEVSAIRIRVQLR